MSTVTVFPGARVRFDPSDKRTITFDFDALNLPVGVQLTAVAFNITALRQLGGTALTKDNEGLVSGNRKAIARFLATTATLGDRYQVACKGTTNESPVQEKEYSIFIDVEEG